MMRLGRLRHVARRLVSTSARALAERPVEEVSRRAIDGVVEAEASTATPHHLREITYAVAPVDNPTPELPQGQVDDLNALYEALIQPLSYVPTQQERAENLRHTEAVDAVVFFAERDFADPEQHAHRIRCLGAQGHLALAHEALEAMRKGDGPRPDAACFHALADACARAGDVEAAEAVIQTVRREPTVRLTAPLFTSLIGAHRRAGSEDPPKVAAQVMSRLRAAGVVEDAPLHTAVICWFLAAKLPSDAWAAFDDSQWHAVTPDAVTYTAMMVACAQEDRLEHAQNLFNDMRTQHIHPTLATHNAFLSVCVRVGVRVGVRVRVRVSACSCPTWETERISTSRGGTPS